MKLGLRYAFPACLRRIFIITVSGLIPYLSQAQLQANFTVDKTGGCSPLNVSFTNTTTGASANASYHWSFDNNNTSVLKNAGAVFIEERAYTVTLTVTDGSQTSSQSKTITVYRKPGVEFAVTPAQGCFPLSTTMTSSSTPGDGTISSYTWDFGDGSTQQGFIPSISHTYASHDTFDVSLTVFNNHGCSNTLLKPQAVKAVPPPTIEVTTATPMIACQVPATINFFASYRSNGGGLLTLTWDFGDNTTVTNEMAPSHTYTQKGTYNAKLTITNELGCSVTRNIPNINIANFNTSFQEPALICSNGNVTFTNTSTPTPTQSTWLFDGVNSYTNWGNSPVTYAFGSAGPHTVELTNRFGPCTQTISKQVEVKPKPAVNGFIQNITSNCGSPVQVNFQDTTQGAVSWLWNFDWPFNYPGNSSTLQSPAHTYNADNAYTVALTVTNADGCTASVSKMLGISRPLIGIFLEPGYNDRACGTLTTKFESRTTDPITQYLWDFGDNTTSTDPEPAHTYSQSGTYVVKLTYTTAGGCTSTVIYPNNVIIYAKPQANFTVQPTVCGNTPVVFTSTTIGPATQLAWNFGDHAGFMAVHPTNHKYQHEGFFDVTMIAFNGLCRDTIKKTAVIQVFPPFPRVASAMNTCDGTRGMVRFADDSRQANSWNWNFGDNQSMSYTNAQSIVPHEYGASGKYKVVLTATNGACVVKDSITAYVLLKQNPVLALNDNTICAGSATTALVNNLERPVLPPIQMYSYPNDFPYIYFGFTKPDGSNFEGNVYGADLHTFPWTATLSSNVYGETQIRMITQSNFYGCNDTSNFVTLSVRGPSAAIEANNTLICFKNGYAVMRDISTSRNSIPIVKCEWSFGDNTYEVTAPGATVNHRYNSPGDYYVTLKVTDAEGCTSAASRTIRVTGPKASFYTSASNPIIGELVQFANTSNVLNLNLVHYHWDFGDNSTSALHSPWHAYSSTGTYTATLIARSSDGSCADTAKQVITVREMTGGFITNLNYLGNQNLCPPVMATFTSTATNFSTLTWNLGNGVSMRDRTTVSAVYSVPGTYIVSLHVHTPGNTKIYYDTIVVNQPRATLVVNDLSGCIGDQLVLTAPVHDSVATYTWDFGNGAMMNSTDSFATHQYLAAGSYTASLIATDKNGCAVHVSLPDRIVINPDPVIAVNPATPISCKGIAASLTASGAVTYNWSPATGLSNSSVASPLASPANTTTYTVDGTDNNGCTGKGNVTVIVPRPFRMNVASIAWMCMGENVQLNASGAHSYEWIGSVAGLTNTQISNPVASPAASSLYTITGFDQYRCYSDTQRVGVTVHPLPVVNAGADKQVMYGEATQLQVTNSNDVTKWNWTPADFLSCTSCASPVSKPYQTMEYIVTVSTANNCKARDTVRLVAVCGDGSVYIPNAFTPDNNGKNDGFTIYGHGVRLIKSLKIFNRWGEIIFERKNFYPNDASGSWRGKHKGMDAPAGSYVYLAELECDAGQTFMRKGTVTLIR